MKKVIYYGVFFDDEQSKKLYSLDDNPLDRISENLHVTFRYYPFPNERINDVVGKEIELKVIGKGNDGRNSGLLIEIPEEYKKYYRHRYKKDGEIIKIIPHLTLSLSNDSTPKETRDIEFNPIDEPIVIKGKFGYYVSEYVDDKKELKIVYEKVL